MNTTNGRDWFVHSAFVVDSARRQVNAQLDDYSANLAQLLDSRGHDMTICVSGSLARREPAVRRDNELGGYKLASDIDLVAITYDDAHVPAPDLERALNAAHPEIQTTLYRVKAADLHRVAGRFGNDLHTARTHPLAGAPLPDFLAPRCGPREGLEGIVHQLALGYAGEHQGISPWRTKTALEALRASSKGGDGPHCYTHLATNVTTMGLLDRQEVESLIRAREYTLSTPLPEARVYRCVVHAVARLVTIDDTTELGVATAIARMSVRPLHVLNGFQLAVIADTLLAHGSTRLRRCAATALHVAVSSIDRRTLPEAADAAAGLSRISPVDLSTGTVQARAVINEHMRQIRRDYYHWLGKHNFGVLPAIEYLEPAELPIANGECGGGR